ncbi:MAG: DUF1598 domain-containing protein [Planctomycetaceae bacterium]|nr:DUF1598 domain-containing protein [Planctomycetaceae bacterium]
MVPCVKFRNNGHFGLSGEFFSAGFASLLVVAIAATVSRAAAPTPPVAEAQFEEHLAAGEFALARQIAAQNPDANQRDAQLARIAGAQARAGGRDAALETTSLMHGDIARSTSLRDVNQGTAQFVSEQSGAAGGNSAAGFAMLMRLIQNTIAPDSWQGGTASMQPYLNGVYVDPAGVLRRNLEPDATGALAQLHREARSESRDAAQTDVRRASRLRKISLPRLERLVQLYQASGRPLDDEMLLLAGLERIEYVLVYPETGDLVIAGPAGDWRSDADGRLVSAASGHPVVRLEDLVAIWRLMSQRGATFGCTINPRQEALAATHAFLAQSTQKPLKAGGRHAWVKQLQQKLGLQDIQVFDLDPGTRTARVLVEADYHMKLIGMGLVPGTAGVPAYLDMIQLKPGEAPPALDVLRWWFTIDYDAIRTSPARGAYHLSGQGVQLQSENELLTAQGQRVPTGQAEVLNRQFAKNFTEHFADLAARYGVYGELQNLFDLALTGALIASEGLAEQADWHQTGFGPQGDFELPLAAVPASVETVVNHRLLNGKHVVAGVSGGVHVAPAPLVEKRAIEVDSTGALESDRARAQPAAELSRDVWWWD